MAANSVAQALRVLQEAGREDLIKEGVLEQAWVGLKRPKRSSADRVSAVVLACTSPESPKKFRKFRKKSVADRKVSISPDCSDLIEEGTFQLPRASGVRRGGARLLRRSGSSLRQRVAALGRGSSLDMSAGIGRGKVASGFEAHAPRKAAKQAPLALESGGERGTVLSEESTLGGAAKMAAPLGGAVFGSVEQNNVDLGDEQGGEKKCWIQKLLF
ncbi:hypothetical protein NDU88_006392 [Pleurodeles waltl]|uniref:Uncharacterized protein n=1 Tax=Pleurodeles waltl TaxID=8319 RepID=A0AAV7N3X1_PLEWA|nr:hypothetical protein NDU88_006392 [Pleurodeles waltl]